MADKLDKQVLECLKHKLAALVKERESLKKRSQDVERQIAGLQQSVNGMLLYAQGLQDGGGTEWGKLHKAFSELLSKGAVAASLMEACRNAPRIRKPMTAVQVRDYLDVSGFSFANYKSNPLSSIHTPLSRLKEANEVVEKAQGGTK